MNWPEAFTAAAVAIVLAFTLLVGVLERWPWEKGDRK